MEALSHEWRVWGDKAPVDQARNPFCVKIDNKEYMESTKWYYEESFMTRHIDASKIRTDSEEAFVRSLAELGEVEILEDN